MSSWPSLWSHHALGWEAASGDFDVRPFAKIFVERNKQGMFPIRAAESINT